MSSRAKSCCQDPGASHKVSPGFFCSTPSSALPPSSSLKAGAGLDRVSPHRSQVHERRFKPGPARRRAHPPQPDGGLPCARSRRPGRRRGLAQGTWPCPRGSGSSGASRRSGPGRDPLRLPGALFPLWEDASLRRPDHPGGHPPGGGGDARSQPARLREGL